MSLYFFIKKIYNEIKINAGIISIIFISIIEIIFCNYLFNNFFSHEVDKTINNIENKKGGHPVLVLGDSVGKGIFDGWQGGGKVANLACNHATETTGQYFFLKRYLVKNNTPGAVVICDRTPLLGNLDQITTENYIQRVFTQWSEIYQILIIKLDVIYTLKMIAYKIIPSYKYRLHLQKKIISFTNSDIYSGISSGGGSSGDKFSILYFLSNISNKFKNENISEYFFKKIIKDLKKLDVPVYYLPPPVSMDDREAVCTINNAFKKINEIREKTNNVFVVSDLYQELPKEYFSDGVHLNLNGIEIYRDNANTRMNQIVNNAIVHQRQLNLVQRK